MIMNLGKLLGAGKSFISWRGGKAYRQNRRVVLPRFNAGANPFAPSVEAVALPAAPKPAGPVLVKAQTVSISQPVARPVRSTTWAHKLNPFRAPAPEAPQPHRAEQVELSLDMVKPVSNDLEGADIEVVQAKSRTMTPMESLDLGDVPMLPPAREPWEFVGERMVKPV